MQINVIQLGLIKTNCYMLSTDKAAVVIDPGFKSQTVEDFFNSSEGKAKLILLTHAHFDHIGGAEELRINTGVLIGTGDEEEQYLSDTEQNLSDKFHAHISPFNADFKYGDGEEFTVGDLEIKVIKTPGHTPGSVSYLIGNSLFSGDTLFLESVGRTDFPRGNFSDIKASVKKLFLLGDDITVYPGHGEITTVAHEKKYNTFI